MGLLVLPRLYAIVDVEVCARAGWQPRELAQEFLAGGARLLQLRAKSLAGAAFLDLARALTQDARTAGAMLIVNDRADLAVLADAHGVHVGQDDLAPDDVRRVTGPEPLVGLSTHTSEQIAAALTAPISYFAIGPVFGTRTKDTGYESVGYDAIQYAASCGAKKNLPVVAIGGITLETAPKAIEAGAASVAVITDLVTDAPQRRVGEYLAALR